jgi:hypothetical protein
VASVSVTSPFRPAHPTVGRDLAMVAQEARARPGPAIAMPRCLAGAIEQACDSFVESLAVRIPMMSAGH